MICLKCKELDLKSTIQLGNCTRTCMGFSPGHYDESGKFIENKDPNHTYQEYRCSNGHEWTDVINR